MATRKLLSRASMVCTYILASGHTVEEVADKLGRERSVMFDRLGDGDYNNRIIYDISEIIGVDLSFLVKERECGRSFKNG